MRFQTLAQWLTWQESLHSKEIDLGLERVKTVAQDLFQLDVFPHVITVAGTNGKGSVSNLLASIYEQAGYQVGLYTSPHLVRYNERIRINGVDVSDELICDAFDRIDKARKDISLTYFEFGTLAALDIFQSKALDVIILEVGLGGRLDAVNIIDPDVAVISSIDLDHQAWLGEDRESIAREKLGICRPNKPLVLGELDPPDIVEAFCDQHQIPRYRIRHEFAYQTEENQWQWSDKNNSINALPKPLLFGEHQFINASVAIMVSRLLQKRIPVSANDIKNGLLSVRLSGRIQRFRKGDNMLVIDVAHNPQSVKALHSAIEDMPVLGKRIAILGMLKDKDIAGSLEGIKETFDEWLLVDLPGPRSAEARELGKVLLSIGIADSKISEFSSVEAAYKHYNENACADDLLVIFGSFITAGEAMNLLKEDG